MSSRSKTRERNRLLVMTHDDGSTIKELAGQFKISATSVQLILDHYKTRMSWLRSGIWPGLIDGSRRERNRRRATDRREGDRRGSGLLLHRCKLRSPKYSTHMLISRDIGERKLPWCPGRGEVRRYERVIEWTTLCGHRIWKGPDLNGMTSDVRAEWKFFPPDTPATCKKCLRMAAKIVDVV